MKLSDQQLKQFDEEDICSFRACSQNQARLLKSEADNVYAMEREEVWRENQVSPAPPLLPYL